jgi:hypothetical protein
MIKVFYNKEPNKNLVSHETGIDVWHDNIEGENTGYTSIGDMLNTLGIYFEWSKDIKDSIPFINVGSLSHKSKEFLQICEDASLNYEKAIILSTQEPWQKEYIDIFLDRFKNLFFMDTSTHLYIGERYHKRYLPFPFILLKFLSPRSQVNIIHPSISYDKPKYLFNCLMYNWRVDKHVLFTLLKHTISNIKDDAGSLVDENIVTYKKLRQDINPNFQYVNTIDHKQEVIENLENGLDTFEDISLEQEITLAGKHFNSTFRSIPKYVFDDTCFSLVCESFSGSTFVNKFNEVKQKDDILFFDSRPLITEKSILPILNGHPWIVYGEINFHKTMKELGFQIHDELFDMEFDGVICPIVRAENLVHKINNGNDISDILKQLTDYKSITREKILHNQNLLLNKNSILHKELEFLMLNYIEDFYEF